MKKLLSLTMATVTALSCTGIAAAANTSAYSPDVFIEAEEPIEECGTFYEETRAADVEKALKNVKTRISIPEELTEFNYSSGTNNAKTVYTFNWNTPYTSESYREISCTICNTVITYYSDYNYSRSSSTTTLAKLSENELYKYAQQALKQINPSVYKNIVIDKDSLSISRTNNKATFSLVRIKNGIPVANDKGSITINKNTGELISFNINWHTNASFKSAETVISEDAAKEAYAKMINLYPVYELTYDREKDEYISQIIYTQRDHGEINAFTGNKSDFIADGYYDDIITEDAADEESEPETGANAIFTEQELAELNKDLPYGTEEKVREVLESKDYFVINDDMELYSSRLYKETEGKTDKYYYTANFSSADFDKANYWNQKYEDTGITINAETGEIIAYNYYVNDNNNNYVTSFDKEAAAKIADNISNDLAGKKLSEYGEMSVSVNSYTPTNSSFTKYYGSSYSFNRYVNDIVVSGDNIQINLDENNVLTWYYITYTEADFISPENMLSTDEIMDIYWEENDIDLYYLARVHDKKTKTVLVYGTDSSIYCDAFTGEQKYNYSYKNDLSLIDTKSIKKKAEILDNHGFIFSYEKFDETDAVKESDFARVLNLFTEMRMYGFTNELELTNGRIYECSDKEITNADAMIMLTAAECGTKVPKLDGVFKSPYVDIKDTDENVGYYAIAHALTNSTETELKPDESFTYADMIELVYNYIA